MRHFVPWTAKPTFASKMDIAIYEPEHPACSRRVVFGSSRFRGPDKINVTLYAMKGYEVIRFHLLMSVEGWRVPPVV